MVSSSMMSTFGGSPWTISSTLGPPRRQFLVVGDVFPEVAEVLGRERMAVRPFVAGPELQRELAAVLGLVARQNVGMQRQLVVVHDQPGIGVKRHQARVARGGDQHVAVAAGAARAFTAVEDVDDRGIGRDALVDRRQATRLHLVGEQGGFLHRRRGGQRRSSDQRACGQGYREITPFHATLHSTCFPSFGRSFGPITPHALPRASPFRSIWRLQLR